jgi:hypothetical protein
VILNSIFEFIPQCYTKSMRGSEDCVPAEICGSRIYEEEKLREADTLDLIFQRESPEMLR